MCLMITVSKLPKTAQKAEDPDPVVLRFRCVDLRHVPAAKLTAADRKDLEACKADEAAEWNKVVQANERARQQRIGVPTDGALIGEMLYAPIVVVFGILVLLFLYLIPTIVAESRKKSNANAIFVLNLFLGWTIIGWVGALVWAMTVDPPKTATAEVGGTGMRGYSKPFVPR
jgi:Superinfection immunity protein